MMRVLKSLRHGSKLVGIGMLGVALQGGLGGVASAATAPSLTIQVNPNPVVLLSGTNVAQFNVGVTGATASSTAIEYLDTLNGTGPTGTCADSLNGSTTNAADDQGRMELNPVISGSCSAGKYHIIVIDGSKVALTEYEILSSRP